ncbi:nucleotide-diphosphate-sugar epimerase [Terrabacter tumescens]|uniref:Nucleotide-diphosphate-sugar epimerase n=1 Tax=Terrabacter tumescens TaxID=60443 RepID=A0ABQ2HTR2_9MICO|nr:sugar nucleotide-binding protein [Terrabacter tumescens]GGM90560.1 nucleotide-diphosphate-sugar epimerase [Terrabacter tumescens]
MRIVVTGGAGDLGSRVVREVTARGHQAVSASRRSGVDLTTGAGLDGVLTDADAVVHCADDTSRGDDVTVYATRRLADAAAAHGTHLVHISIVGIDDHPLSYYRRKLRAEQGIAAAGGPASVLRATQFHSLTAFFARSLTVGPFAVTIGDMALQPVDTDFVAQRLVDLALGPMPTAYARATDVAGPEVVAITEVARLVRTHRGASAPRTVRLPPVGRLMRAVSESRTVPAAGSADLGGRTFADWLAAQPPRLSGR